MNKSNIMKAAHKIAKTFVGNYSARLSLALKKVYEVVKNEKIKRECDNIQTKIKDLFNGYIDNTQIILSANTYEIKETLKEIGFKFIPKSWVINTNNLVETLEIAKKVISLKS